MKPDQKFTSKYWVGQYKNTDDVFIQTASKTRSETVKLMEEMLGEDWFMDEDFEVVLIEVKLVAEGSV